MKAFPDMEHRKNFFGLQSDMEITGKYRGSRSIVRTWKGFIYLSNKDPRVDLSEEEIDFLNINCDFVTLDTHLF